MRRAVNPVPKKHVGSNPTLPIRSGTPTEERAVSGTAQWEFESLPEHCGQLAQLVERQVEALRLRRFDPVTVHFAGISLTGKAPVSKTGSNRESGVEVQVLLSAYMLRCRNWYRDDLESR